VDLRMAAPTLPPVDRLAPIFGQTMKDRA
jgi:hypothetical protein